MRAGQLIKAQYDARPLWMNGLLFFCAYMTFIYLPWDIFFKPVAVDQEVWFGIMFTGWAAKGGALLHWLVYGAGTFGFLRMKAWMHPWATLYIAQIALSMFIWSFLAMGGSSDGIVTGLVSGGIFIFLALVMWRAKSRFISS